MTTTVGAERVRTGKFLTFKMGQEDYGIEVLKVREIISMLPITAVPRAPKFVKGLVNLRGKVIPVIDLRMKFEMEATFKKMETCIIIVDLGRIEIGVVVDQVSEVVDIMPGGVEEAPEYGLSIDTSFILGIGTAGEKVRILLDIQNILTEDEIEKLENAVAGEAETGAEA